MTIDELLAEAAALPLRDAAYAIWRQKINFERLEGRVWPRRDQSTPEAREKSMREIRAQIKHEHDFAQDGPTFDRLKRAHPRADDTEAKLAIIAAVRFDDACFKHFTVDSTDYWQRVVRAVALAQRQENPGYLEGTYEAARDHVAYYMK